MRWRRNSESAVARSPTSRAALRRRRRAWPDNSDPPVVAESRSPSESSFPPCGGRSGWGASWRLVAKPSTCRADAPPNRPRCAQRTDGATLGLGRGVRSAHRAGVLRKGAAAWVVAARGPTSIVLHDVRGHSTIPGNERADEIAVSFAAGEHPGFHDGPRSPTIRSTCTLCPTIDQPVHPGSLDVRAFSNIAPDRPPKPSSIRGARQSR